MPVRRSDQGPLQEIPMRDVADYTILHYDEIWVVSRGDRILASFPSRTAAEAMVHEEAEALYEEGRAHSITIQDGSHRVEYCRWFAPPAGENLWAAFELESNAETEEERVHQLRFHCFYGPPPGSSVH
jgi:hypothetical protein